MILKTGAFNLDRRRQLCWLGLFNAAWITVVYIWGILTQRELQSRMVSGPLMSCKAKLCGFWALNLAMNAGDVNAAWSTQFAYSRRACWVFKAARGYFCEWRCPFLCRISGMETLVDFFWLWAVEIWNVCYVKFWISGRTKSRDRSAVVYFYLFIFFK